MSTKKEHFFRRLTSSEILQVSGGTEAGHVMSTLLPVAESSVIGSLLPKKPKRPPIK